MDTCKDGRPVVLVVDDDEDVRRIGAVIVGELGYGAIEATSAQNSMEVLRGPGRVDLLMTDLAMPDLSGMELAQLAVHLRPHLKVLYSSAHVRASSRSPVLLHYGPLIEKPWGLDELQGALHELIGPVQRLAWSDYRSKPL
jgi:CheY-like chemotaxis protein